MRASPVLMLMLAAAVVLGPAGAMAQTFNSGSTGADGAFSPTADITLTLPSTGVFNFTTINIPASVHVTFNRNARNTPVTFLASGAVTIAGTIDLSPPALAGNGKAGGSGTALGPNNGLGGPGGFDGGSGSNGIASNIGGSGLGPGGGPGGNQASGRGGGFSLVGGPSGTGGGTYGNETLLPLIGGSGGGGGFAGFGTFAAGGGGGGGAILIASSGTITFTGAIKAVGGSGGAGVSSTAQGGGGSGGAVRLVATTVTGSGGQIDVSGGVGSNAAGPGGVGSPGRIRIEGYTRTATLGSSSVMPSVDQPTVIALASTPVLAITSVGGVSAPVSPTGSFNIPDVTLPATGANPVAAAVGISGSNIPPGASVSVTVTGQTGGTSAPVSATLTGTIASTTANATVNVPTNQPSLIFVTATFTPTASAGGGPVYADGEVVDRVRVTAAWGGTSDVTYITHSGREIAALTR